ncbi:hypothetical protein K505DRAFT_308700 [Melanomma pulvis-pyrius CBS 109.77]|uniref:AB hydrolase-1 domain-containing protein n=1 Tax=Melanomma pulvis-pyrius CBS 109.77 TaxID=1314802 RepID=A0A6A6X6B3_9PLEO|nr:hypothetical protein K505DRAFT_308700 [Melanomma pulvis-pyrius CBS 109.77]
MATYGLMEVYEGETPAVDIVFLHGLRGDVKETWSKGPCLWPRDLLATDLPNSRILLYGYDSSITHWDQSTVAQTDLRSDAEDMCAKLAAKRASTDSNDRPIILIAHSLGGLVAAQAVILGEGRPEGDAAKELANHLRGMMFFGTPFRGSSTAGPAEIVRRILSVFGVNTQDQTLRLLGMDSERLTQLNYEFPELLRKRLASQTPGSEIKAFFFYESLKTSGVMVVDRASAQLPGCGESSPIRADHRGMCKFGSKSDEGYDVALRNIENMILPGKNENLPATEQRNIYNSGKILNLAQGNMNIGSMSIGHF